MNQRSKEILNVLIERKESRLSDMAEIYEVSERTIRNDIVALNDYLADVSYGYIDIKKKKIQLHLTVDKQELLKDINKFDVYEYKFTSDERSLICLLILINSIDYVTIQQLSEKLLTSRSTIVNDLRSMRALAERQQIEIISKANKGYKIQAREEDIRSFLYQVTGIEHFSILEMVMFEEDYKEKVLWNRLESTINEHRQELDVTEKDLGKIMRYLTVSAYRNYKGHQLEGEETSCQTQVYRELADWTSDYPYLTPLDFVFVEKMLGNKAREASLENSMNKESIRIQVVAMRFIEKISQELKIDFKDDYIFYDHFSAHLLRMLRKENHAVHSPIFMEEIVNSNKTIKEAILHHISIIESSIGRKASPVEVDYIIIHVYAAMERKKRKGNNLKVALLTQEKATEIFLIESKLNNNFAFNLDIYSVDDKIQGHYDLILTTTGLPNHQYLQISPVISDEDYILIANEIDRIIKEKEVADFTLDKEAALRVYEMVSKEIDKGIASETDLKHRIRTAIFSCVAEESEKDSSKQLLDFLPVDRISVDVQASNWKEAIYQAGQLLIERGDIEPAYLDVVVENIEENGPYIVISSGFAFPHAQIGEYNKQTAMHLVRLQEPVYFDDELHDDPTDIGTQPVSYICLLSATSSQEHSKAFFNLSNLLKNQTFKEKLDACPTPLAIHNLIEEYEALLDIRR